nr:hypothetical protein [Tanacetum cinerariifolium]
MTIETHNWASSAHQELHKIVREEFFPIVNQVDARGQNFEIQFLKEAAKFVGDFKSLANEADTSLAKYKALELEIKRFLKAVVSQDIMIIVQNESVVDTSDLQTELERTKECFENCIIKKETKYAKLWNDCYKKCAECKYDKISYDKAYKDMQQKIERLQAQLGDLKGKSKDTSSVSDTRNPLSQKLENENLELEFQVLNYARENAHLKAIYKNLFDSISVSRAQTKTIIASLQNELQSNIYKNAKLRTQLFKKVSDQKDNTHDTISSPQESKGVNNDKVIAPGMFRINPSRTSRETKKEPNTDRASDRTKPITISLPPVFTRKDVNSNLNGLSSTGVDNTKTRRPQPRSNKKNDRVPSASKSSRSKNKEAKVEAHHRNLLLFKNNKHISSACNNIKIDSQEVGTHESLATPKPRKSRLLLRWSPTGKLFDKDGKIVDSNESKSQFVCSNGDNACTFNAMEPKIKWFPNSTSLIDRLFRFVYGLGHNLFSIGQFCDSDLDVKFRRNACFVRNLEGVDLLKGDRSTNLYIINLHEMAFASPIYLMARASSTKSWLWHQRLSHLNSDTINDLARNDLVAGLPKFKYHKEHLCPACEQGKSKRASHPPKSVPNSRQRLHLLHIDLCGPMRIASINEKRYVLVIVDDYSRYTWVHFHRSKDEAPEVIIKFLKRITVLLQSLVIIIRTDNGIEFKNQVLKEYFDNVGISHQMSSVRTLQQNGVVERRNWTLVEAARPMLIFSRAPLFLWAEEIATTCFTQNRSIIHRRFNKTPYELINGKKPDISFLHVFGALCYPKNDREDIRKLGAKGDIGFFISSKPGLNSMTSGHISSGLDLIYAPSTITTQQPSEGELDLLFEAMYNDYIGGQPSTTAKTVSPAQEPHVRQSSTASTTIAYTAPIPTNSSSLATNFLITSQDVDELNPNAMVDGNTFVNPFANSSTSVAVASSSQNVDPSNMHTFYQPYPHEFQWTKDHPLEQVIGEPSRPVLTRNQLRSDGDMCMYALSVSTMEPKNVKEAMTDPAWIDSMQEDLLQFKRLDVWVLAPTLDNISPLTLKWLFKNKHDEEQTVIKNKSRLVVRGYLM